MKKKENQEIQQNGTAKKSRLKMWKCAISIAVCVALVATIVLGVVACVSGSKISALRVDLDRALGTIEAMKVAYETLLTDIDSLKNSLLLTSAELEILKNDYQSANQRLEALEEENKSMKDKIEALKDQLHSANGDKIRIYIDQGHNPAPYHNSGAVGNGLAEHDLTFIIGCALAELLQQDGRFEICLSRPNKGVVLGTDNTTSNQARVEGATNFDADYLISLHINAYDGDSAHGIEVYTTGEGTESYAFGNALLDGMTEATGLRNRGMKENPELYILKNATMPAALLEMGFISNSTDAAVLAENPELFAEGIYNGLLDYFGLLPIDSAEN